ncbi:MAG: hypothetical protein L0Z50_05260 [Verrucomicrobiales bacterium]|nr:hypothetical protein [Verrucomicrobiales bacterium]
MAERVESLKKQWQTNLEAQANLPVRVLDWPTALAQLRAGNLKLRQARTEVTNSQEAVRQVFRDLAPTLNLRSGVNKRLKDISNLNFNDVTFSADSFFSLPGVVSFGARFYATRLYELRAETAFVLTEREQIIELYKLIRSLLDTQDQAQHLTNQLVTALAFEKVDPLSGQVMLSEVQVQQAARTQELETLQQRASELLGSRAARWAFTTNGLPDLHYEQNLLPLHDTNRVAQLQMRLLGIELEAERAVLTGIKLRYWPELQIYVTAPPIYQRFAGRDRFWDAGEVRANADLFWFVDTRGVISRQVRQTKRQQAIDQERFRQESLALIERLLFTQGLLKTTQENLRRIEDQLKIVEAVPPAQDYDALVRYASDYRSLVDQQRRWRRDLAELNALFWFVDEQAWGEVSPLPRLAKREPQP